MTSITRKIHSLWVREKLKRIFFEDVLIALIMHTAFVISNAYSNYGEKFISYYGDKISALADKRDGDELAAVMMELFNTGSMHLYYRYLIIAMSAILIVQLIGLLIEYPFDNKKIRKILRPINEIALKADELSRMTFDENTFVGFRPLKKADDDSQLVFPAFTDELATMSWKEAFQKDQPKRFATMQLPHLLQYVNNGHAGLVVNPFGPVPVYFPKELLAQVEKSEVFRKRYVRQAPVTPEAPAQEKTAESAPESTTEA